MTADASLNHRLRANLDRQTVATFVATTAACSAAWTLALRWLGMPPTAGSTGFWLFVFASMVLSVSPALVVYALLPETPVDFFHRVGMLFSMYLPINVAVSLSYAYYYVFLSRFGAGGAVESVIAGVVIASLFLPGPYAGVFLARRVNRWRRPGTGRDGAVVPNVE